MTQGLKNSAVPESVRLDQIFTSRCANLHYNEQRWPVSDSSEAQLVCTSEESDLSLNFTRGPYICMTNSEGADRTARFSHMCVLYDRSNLSIDVRICQGHCGSQRSKAFSGDQ